ncbi:heat induced stress protein YflT [Sinobaca qinghaiensis]|uniref:Heat induced stress protein YflT n=1 Tax=Sinobaca qinghaiensis TaxID=342944 RepID=A0A419V4W0_9BACL|nr:general stress protein [Sinobaca qinghaiensis]RKD73550.1 heat induced stress protein YflT [Sinobaca qinghaiensis]
MDPKFKLFHNDESLGKSIGKLTKAGVSGEDLYVISFDRRRTRRNKKNTDAKKIGRKEMGVGTVLKNIFRGRQTKVEVKLKRIGFDAEKAEKLRVELEKGKILLIVTNQEKVRF